jgi:hypothetical protein
MAVKHRWIESIGMLVAATIAVNALAYLFIEALDRMAH